MAYAKQTWNNGADGGTPQSAARYNHMENGIAAAAATADAAAPKTTIVQAGRATNVTKRDGTTPVVNLAHGEFVVNVILGTNANSACAGNDARLSDQRVPRDGSVTNGKLAAGSVDGRALNAEIVDVINKAMVQPVIIPVASMPATPVEGVVYLVVP